MSLNLDTQTQRLAIETHPRLTAGIAGSGIGEGWEAHHLSSLSKPFIPYPQPPPSLDLHWGPPTPSSAGLWLASKHGSVSVCMREGVVYSVYAPPAPVIKSK